MLTLEQQKAELAKLSATIPPGVLDLAAALIDGVEQVGDEQ